MTLLSVVLALALTAALAACGSDAAPGEDATTAAPAPEATDRVRAPAPGSPAPDREILVTVYNALDGPNWENSENWLSDAPLGEWYSVTTAENGRVVRLQIGGSGYVQELSGEIPPELGDLGALTVLTLSGEALGGEIPAELGSLSNLSALSFYDNELSGEIPAELDNLSNLVSLGLSSNDLSGCVPSSLEDDLLLFDFSNLGGLPFC